MVTVRLQLLRRYLFRVCSLAPKQVTWQEKAPDLRWGCGSGAGFLRRRYAFNLHDGNIFGSVVLLRSESPERLGGARANLESCNGLPSVLASPERVRACHPMKGGVLNCNHERVGCFFFVFAPHSPAPFSLTQDVFYHRKKKVAERFQNHQPPDTRIVGKEQKKT